MFKTSFQHLNMATQLLRVARSASCPLPHSITNSQTAIGTICLTCGDKIQSRRSMSTNVPFALNRMSKDLQLGEAKDKNFVFSPCSIQLALSLIANGAKGSTLNELLTFSEAENQNHLKAVAKELVSRLVGSTKGSKLSFISGIWVDKFLPLNPNFKADAEKIYKANVEAVGFQNEGKEITREVNKWAEEATNGLIKSILSEDSLDPTTAKLVLANALYFKGKWSKAFDESYTTYSNFYLQDGKFVRVPFMTNLKKQFINSFQEFKVLRLPYKKSVKRDLSMYIILPNARDGLWSLVEKAGSDPMFMKKYVNPDAKAVEVGKFKVPKFKMAYDFETSKSLQGVGLKLCFSDKAEFGEIVVDLEPGCWVEVSNVHHKSYIEVSEEGTEAAAVTTKAMMKAKSKPAAGRSRVDFVADRPFMFVVREDNSGMVFFMGHVVNPLLE